MLLIAMPSFLSGYQLDDFYLGYTSPREYGGYLPAMPTFDITSNSVTSLR